MLCLPYPTLKRGAACSQYKLADERAAKKELPDSSFTEPWTLEATKRVKRRQGGCRPCDRASKRAIRRDGRRCHAVRKATSSRTQWVDLDDISGVQEQGMYQQVVLETCEILSGSPQNNRGVSIYKCNSEEIEKAGRKSDRP
jgi:hypothetical protein